MRSVSQLINAATRINLGVNAFLVVLCVQAFNFLDRGQPWRGEWNWTVDWVGGGLILAGPLVAGICAVDGGRLRDTSRLPRIDSLPTPMRSVMGAWLSAVLSCLLGHLISVTVFIATSASQTDLPRAPGLLLIGCQVLALAVYCSVGLLTGRHLGAVIGPPAAAGISVALFWFFGRGDTGVSPFGLGSATASLLGFQFSVRYIAFQAVALMVVTGLLIVSHLWPGRMTRYMGPAVSTLVLVGAQSLPASVVRLDSVAVWPSLCQTDGITVCVYPDHARFLPELFDKTSRLHGAAVRLGLDLPLPTTYVERIPGEGPRPAEDNRGRLEILPGNFATGSVDTHDLAWSVLLPWHCQFLFGKVPPPPEFDQIMRIATSEVARLAEPDVAPGTPASGAAADIVQVQRRLRDFHRCLLSKE